ILDGEKIVTDCGAYLYTSSYKDRNKFRSTACHNTPQVDGEEINRFVRPDYLWSLHYDATPQVHAWNTDGHITEFVGSHAGYSRLEAQLAPKRRIRLEHASHTLTVTDEIRGSGDHHVEIPLHLAAGVDISEQNDNGFLLEKNGKLFRLTWLANGGWQVRREPARVSPSYGVVTRTLKLLWCFDGLLPAKLVIVVVPVTKF
ncbi:MAG: heparinase II/III domain-containing protein, partial [Gammaproteobacteria bacterium]